MGPTPYGPDIEMYTGTYIEPPPIPDSLLKEIIDKPKPETEEDKKKKKIENRVKENNESEAPEYVSSSVVSVQRTDKRS